MTIQLRQILPRGEVVITADSAFEALAALHEIANTLDPNIVREIPGEDYLVPQAGSRVRYTGPTRAENGRITLEAGTIATVTQPYGDGVIVDVAGTRFAINRHEYTFITGPA